MPNQPAWDSFSSLIGVSTRPTDSPLVAHRALNMDFRRGNEPRNALVEMRRVYEDAAKDKETFEKGNVQKVMGYNGYSSRPTMKIYLIAGVLFKVLISGHTHYISRLYDGLRPDVMIGWMCQGFEWLVVQNGSDKAVIWDGINPAFQADPEKAEMPIGGPMAFTHQCFAVVSQDGKDKIAVGDRWQQANSRKVVQFTDVSSWAGGGIFGLHADLGHIMALGIVPQIKLTPDGQGDLFIGGTNGAQTLNLQAARATWQDSQIQDIALKGSGIASYHGYLNVNSSMYFIGEKGLKEVLRTRTEFTQGDTENIESGDVELYWRRSNPNLRSIIPLGHHDNRVFMGVLPTKEKSTSWGMHHYCEGWTTLDVSDRYRGGQRLPRAWNGLQCGVRPIEWVSDLVVNRVHRSYVVSHDADGINRTYEVTSHGVNDQVNGTAVPIKSYFISPILGTKGELKVKQPVAVRVDCQNINGHAAIGWEWMSAGNRCHVQGSKEDEVMRCAEDISKFQMPGGYADSVVFSDPVGEYCTDPAPTKVRLKINMTGRADACYVYVKFKESVVVEENLRAIFYSKCSDDPVRTATCQEDFELYNIV